MNVSSAASTSPVTMARWAGAFWLTTIVTGFVSLAGGDLARAANMVATIAYIGATWVVYVLLKPVSRSLSLLAACFSMVGCAIGLARMFLPALNTFGETGFIFFGLHCLLVGYLIMRSTFIPRAVGALLAFGGLSWLVFGLASLIAPSFARILPPYILLPGIFGESVLTAWLLIKGVDRVRWNELARQPNASTEAG